MSEYYYLSSEKELIEQGKAVLDEAETIHLTRVMRQSVGDNVLLFDGSGREFLAKISRVTKQKTELEILEIHEPEREPNTILTMAVALPKGDRQKWLIEKMTELGVHQFIPLETARSDIKIDQNVFDRLERQVIEASKQCGRLRLMKILPKQNLSSFLRESSSRMTNAASDFQNERPSASPQKNALSKESEISEKPNFSGKIDESIAGDETLRILAHPISDGLFGQWSFGTLWEKVRAFQEPSFAKEKVCNDLCSELESGGLENETCNEKNFAKWRRSWPKTETYPKKIVVVIGPVGGLTDDEVRDAIAADWLTLDLGAQVYRVETAAIVAASLFLHWNERS